MNIPPGLQCVCFIPEEIGKTSTARGVLSNTITRKEAVFNIGRVAWLINALASNNIDQLRYGVEDALHQVRLLMLFKSICKSKVEYV